MVFWKLIVIFVFPKPNQMKHLHYFFVLSLLVISCQEANPPEYIIAGKILFEPSGQGEKKLELYDNGSTTSIEIQTSETSLFCNFKWFGGEKSFVALEHSKIEDKQSYLTKMDLKGKPILQFYEFPQNETVINYYPSASGEKLLYTYSAKKEKTTIPSYDWASIKVVDMQSGLLIDSIQNLAASIHLNIKENCWSMDETKFIYVISHETDIVIHGETNQDNNQKFKSKIPGFYLYNLANKQNQLEVEDTRSAIWSSDDETVLFERNEIIFQYNLISGQEEILYDSGLKGVVFRFFLTPEKEHVYINTGWEVESMHISDEKEILLRINDKQEVPFQHLNFRSGLYSWIF